MPFIPNILPEATSAVTVENPLLAAVEEESTEDAAEQVIITPGLTVQTITVQVEEAKMEVEEIPSAEHADGGEGESVDEVTKGKASSG